MTIGALAVQLRESRGFAHKRDIGAAMRRLGPVLPPEVPVGDDCAAIPDDDGWLLFAIEGLVEDFVERMPWFAGWPRVGPRGRRGTTQTVYCGPWCARTRHLPQGRRAVSR